MNISHLQQLPYAAAVLAWLMLMVVPFAAAAEAPPVSVKPASDAPSPPSPPLLVEAGVRWPELSRAQQAALKPLEVSWPAIASDQKQKWLEVSARLPALSPAEQARVQARMAEWARMTPLQRGQARLRFGEAKRVAPEDRVAQWDAYQALPPEQKRDLASRAAPAPAPVAASGAVRAGAPEVGVRTVPSASPTGVVRSARDTTQPKSNIVVSNPLAVAPKPVTATLVQAQPGATTNLLTRQPTPPAHQQTGLPKIAASPGFVDKNTLLPQRGPQGAAVHSAAASAVGPGQR